MIERLFLLGVSHQTAPVAVRERIARLAEDPRLSNDQLCKLPGVAEGMLLSTCNRVELYAAGQPPEQLADGFRSLLSGEPTVLPHLYERRGEAALRHLFRVASSLDSMVVGEPQILGQLKDAFRAASRSGTAGDTLHRAVGRAFAVAKRVRTETDVGRSAVSMVQAGIELSERVFDSLKGKRAIVVGAGEMARLALARLLTAGVAELVVANRTLANAQALAARLDRPGVVVRAVPLEQLPDELVSADLVISAVATDQPLINAAHLLPRRKARRFHPLLLVDLALPRSIDPALAKLDSVYLKDLDDIGLVVAQNTSRRSQAAERAEHIVDAEVDVFVRVLRGRSAAPVLNALRQRGAHLAEEEATRTLQRLGPDLTDAQRQSVEAMALAIVNKLLHAPTEKLRKAAEAGEASVLAEATSELFGLDADKLPTPEEPDGDDS